MKLEAVHVNKSFLRNRSDSNILWAVQTTDLSLEAGSLTALSGPSGSGKSTLLNMFAGLLPPASGQILLDETDLYQQEDKALSRIRNRHLGVIPQGQSALQALNILENILVPYLLYGKRSGSAYESAVKYAEELMEKAGIRELKNEMPSELSGGELRRMAVCRALLKKPEIVLADEPTGDLDDENTETVMQLLKEHAAAGGTVLVVTHDRQVWDYADRILEMKNGQIVS